MPQIELTRVLDILRGASAAQMREIFVGIFPPAVVASMQQWERSRNCGSCRRKLIADLTSHPNLLRQFIEAALKERVTERESIEVREKPAEEERLPNPLTGKQFVIDDTAEAYEEFVRRARRESTWKGLTVHVRTPGQLVVSFF